MAEIVVCPSCGGATLAKYGKAPSGAQKYRCLNGECSRQFVAGSTHLIDPTVKNIVLGLLAEGVPPAKIQRAVKSVSRRWIYELRRQGRGFANGR